MLKCQSLNKKCCTAEATVITLDLVIRICPEQYYVRNINTSAATFVVTFGVCVYFTIVCLHLSEIN